MGKMELVMYNNFYKDKKILVTGHTGFKGSWLCLWLNMLDAKVFGYALKPNTKPNLFTVLNLEKYMQSHIADIRNKDELETKIKDFEPDMVFHLAAQPLVRLSYSEPLMTYETNVIGTLNVLESARKCKSVKAFINITTDKCYKNYEKKVGYKEDEPLGGHDMYSSSKACAEILTSSYRDSFLQNDESFLLASVRAGNVIGGGDWALDRLIPDCMRAIAQNETVTIRNPQAIRPWQHVLEPLSGYLLLGKKLLEEGGDYAQAYNFGPHENDILNVMDVTNYIIEKYGKGEVKVLKEDNLHESNILLLNIEKAKQKLAWQPTYDTKKALEKTVEWYKVFYENENKLFDFTQKQILNFEQDIVWNKN